MSHWRTACKFLTRSLRLCLSKQTTVFTLVLHLLGALLLGGIAYGFLAYLLLQFTLGLEALFAIGFIIGLLIWAIAALAQVLSAALMRKHAGLATAMPLSLVVQILRYQLATPWLNPDELEDGSAKDADKPQASETEKWHYGLDLLLPLIALRGVRLEEALNTLKTMRQDSPLKWNPRNLSVLRLTRSMSWLGIIIATGLGSLAAFLYWQKFGNGKLVLLEAAALGLGLGLFIALAFLLPAGIAKSVYLGEVFALETSLPSGQLTQFLGLWTQTGNTSASPLETLSQV